LLLRIRETRLSAIRVSITADFIGDASSRWSKAKEIRRKELHESMFCSVLAAEAAETLMIGDDIRVHIGGAQGAGIRGLLVRSGKFRPQDLRGEIQPDGVLDSIADLPAWWVENL
jgi:ribonucleotide monophosphatase NagD (HAD superfamily)